MRLGLGLGIGVERLAGGGGGADYPIARRDLREEDDFLILLEDPTPSSIVLSYGTYDVLLLEDPTAPNALLTESTTSPGKFILTVY